MNNQEPNFFTWLKSQGLNNLSLIEMQEHHEEYLKSINKFCKPK